MPPVPPDEIEKAVQRLRETTPGITPQEEEDFARFYVRRKLQAGPAQVVETSTTSPVKVALPPSPNLPVDVRIATEGAEAGGLGQGYQGAIEEVKRRFSPEEAGHLINKSQFASKAFQKARQSYASIEEEVKKIEDIRQREGLLSALNEAKNLHNRTVGPIALSGLQKAAIGIDTLDRVYRELVDSVREGRTAELGNAFWHEKRTNKPEEQAGEFEKYHQFLTNLFPESVQAGARKFAQGVAEASMEEQGHSREIAKEAAAIEPGAISGRLLSSLAQPTTLLAAGLGPSIKIARQQGMRMLEGVAPATQKAGAQMIGEAYGNLAGKELEEEIKRIIQVTGANPAKAARVVGENAEFLGKPGLQVAGFDTNRLVGMTPLPEQGVRRLIEKGVRKAASTKNPVVRGIVDPFRPYGMANVPYHQRQALKQGIRAFKHGSLSTMKESFDEFAKNVAPEAAGISKPRQEELIREFFDPEIEMFQGAWRRKQTGAPFPLTPNEDSFLNAFEKFLKDRDLGFGVTHPVTGKYVPRQFGQSREPLLHPESPFHGEAGEFAKANPFATRGTPGKITVANKGAHPPMLQELTVDNPGVALGAAAKEGIKAQYDPFKIAAQFSRSHGYRKAGQEYQRFLADNFGETSQRHAGLEGFVELKRSNGMPVYVPQELVKEGARVFNGFTIPFYDAAMNGFKEVNLLSYGRFHITNFVEDVTKMLFSGFKNPSAFAKASRVFSENTPDARVIFTSGTGKPVTAGEMRKVFRDSGVDISHGGAQDFGSSLDPRLASLQFEKAKDLAELPGLANLPRRLARQTIRAPGQALSTAYRDVAGFGPLRRGGRFAAEKWEKYSKGAFIIDGMMQGQSSVEAALRASRFLFDHGVQSSAQQLLRRLSPFIGYTMRTTALLPKMIAQNPRLASLPTHLKRGFGEPESKEDVPPERISNRYPTLQSRGGFKNAVFDFSNQVGEATGGLLGGKIDPGYNLAIGMRGQPIEGGAGALELLTGDPSVMAQQLGPLPAAFYEATSKQDIMTGAKKSAPSWPEVFPYGTPGIRDVAPSLIAAPNQLTPLTRQGASLMGPGWQLLGNIGARALGAEGAIFGANRQFAEDEGVRNLLQAIYLGTGMPLTLTDPTQQWLDVAGRPAPEKLQDLRGQKRKVEKKKALEKRRKK